MTYEPEGRFSDIPKRERVQIPAYTDRWMMGDRYGEVVRLTRSPDSRMVACVRLDKSGKTVRVIYGDCTPV